MEFVFYSLFYAVSVAWKSSEIKDTERRRRSALSWLFKLMGKQHDA
ncbi:hypothetical protein [Shewanella waksmanii]